MNSDGRKILANENETFVDKNITGDISSENNENAQNIEIIIEDANDIAEQELYYCNNCDISFLSINDHVKKYHAGEEVAVVDTDISNDDKLKDSKPTASEIVQKTTVSRDDISESEKEYEVIYLVKDPSGAFTSQEEPSSIQGIYKCQHCDLSHTSSKLICAHMKMHTARKVSDKRHTNKHKNHKESQKKITFHHKCEVCRTFFRTNKSLQLHKRMHEPKVGKPKSITIVSNATEEGGDQRHCSTCNRSIKIDALDTHECNTSEGSDKFTCGKCNRVFNKMVDYTMHLKAHGSQKNVPFRNDDDELNYPCNYCGRKFLKPYEKVKHERIHTGEKPYSCDICGKKFRVPYCLTLHLRTHSDDRPYTCQHCKKKFKSSNVYNFHLLTHSDARDYKCDICPKSFKTPVQLAGHKNSHSKPFLCDECNRPFASLYAVRLHSATHQRNNNLKYECNICGAKYARQFALKDHLGSQH